MDVVGRNRQLNRHDSGALELQPHGSVISHDLPRREIRSHIVGSAAKITVPRPDLLNDSGQPRHHLRSQVSTLALVDDEKFRNAKLKLVGPGMLDIVVARQVVPEVHVPATALGNGIAHGNNPRPLARWSELSAVQIVPEGIPVNPYEAHLVSDRKS